MADKKTFANKDMVGTPRGYVKKKDIERVDREMRPILEGAAVGLSFTPLGRVARTGAALYRGARAAKKGAEAIQRAKTASGPARRYAPKGAKQVVKEAPKKSDGRGKGRAGKTMTSGAAAATGVLSGVAATAVPLFALHHKLRNIREAPVDVLLTGKPGGARPETPGSYPASKPAAPKSPPASFETAYQNVNRKHGTDRAARIVQRQIPIPKPKPAVDKSRVAGKSKTRIAFEQEFAKQRKAGKKEFTFKGKKYTTKLK